MRELGVGRHALELARTGGDPCGGRHQYCLNPPVTTHDPHDTPKFQPASVSQPAEPRQADDDIATVLVDGSNVAHAVEGQPPCLASIIAVRDKLVEEGLEPIIVVDAALRHQIDDPDGYERLVEQGAIRQAPAGTDADYFILSFARELNAGVVSNDRFRDRAKAFHDVCERVIRYMVVEGEVVLERRMKGRR